MKKWIYSLSATAIALGSTFPAAFAATGNTTNSSATTATISLNNTVISTPGVATKNKSVYIPVWYAMQVLKSMGIQSEWNGQSWKLTTADNSVQVNSSENPADGNGIQVYVNGKLVTSIPYLFSTDPASHRKTAYLQIENMNDLLKTLNVSANWDGHTWRWLTGDAKDLAVAFANTQSAPHTQFTGNLSEQIQLAATDQKTAETNGMPANIDITMKLQGSTEVTNGERSMYMTITSSSPADSTSSSSTPAAPITIQEYLQGNHLWINMNGSWQEQTASEQLIQSLQSQNPMNNIGFNALQQIHASVNGDATTYTATLNASSMSDTLAPLLDSLVQNQTTLSGNNASNDTPIPVDQIKSFIETILQQMKGTTTITTKVTNGQSLITGEQATIDMNLPISALSGIANAAGASNSNTGNTNTSAFGNISGMSLHETMDASYTYNDVPVTPPAGLDTTTVTANTQNTSTSGK